MSDGPIRVAIFSPPSIARSDLAAMSSSEWATAYYDLSALPWFVDRGSPVDALVIVASNDQSFISEVASISRSRNELILIVNCGQGGDFTSFCLESGADDVMTVRPSSELISVKLVSLMRRSFDVGLRQLERGEALEFDGLRRLITLSDGRQQTLSAMEAIFFRALASAGVEYVDPNSLTQCLNVSDVYLRNMTSRINKKFIALTNEHLIERVRFRGYRLTRSVYQS